MEHLKKIPGGPPRVHGYSAVDTCSGCGRPQVYCQCDAVEEHEEDLEDGENDPNPEEF